MVACVAFEWLYCKLLKKTNPISDLSAVVTGIILAMNVPVGMPDVYKRQEQGLAHDLSKYSPTEFIPGCIYYQGDHSPNEAERLARGYSSKMRFTSACSASEASARQSLSLIHI